MLVVGFEELTELFFSGNPIVMGFAAAGVFQRAVTSYQDLAAAHFVERGGVERLLDFLQLRVREPGYDEHDYLQDKASAARLLAGLATLTELCEPIVQGGGFEVIRKLMLESHALAEGYDEFLAAAVRSLACNCPSTLDSITVSAIFQPLLDSLELGDYASKEMAQEALSSLVFCATFPFETGQETHTSPNQTIKWEGLNERVIPRLVELLGTGDADCKTFALQLLRRLATLARTHLAMADSGVIELLHQLMWAEEEVTTARDATLTLWGLLSSPQTQSSVVHAGLRIDEVTVRILQLGPYHHAMQAAGVAREMVMRDPAKINSLIDLGAIPPLVNLLRNGTHLDTEAADTYSNDWEAWSNADANAKLEGKGKTLSALALQALVSADGTAQVLAFDAGAVEALVELLQHGDAPGKRCAASTLMALAFSTTGIHRAIVDTGAVDILKGLLQASLEAGDEETASSAQDALIVFRDLSADPELKPGAQARG
jgi:hypothetical protein